MTADPPTNSLVIQASQEGYAALAAVIEKLDIERPQVLVEALIMEVDVTDAQDLGFDGLYRLITSNTDSRSLFAGELEWYFSGPLHSQQCIRGNVAAGLSVREGGMPSRREVDEIVEDALRRAALWEEVKDQLRTSAVALSGGQQQRLCIARALATKPVVLLLDEPTASLDPASTQKVEELVYELRSSITIGIVTHNMQQAARVSDRTAFMLMGDLVEIAPTSTLFTAPTDQRTEAYITGRFG